MTEPAESDEPAPVYSTWISPHCVCDWEPAEPRQAAPGYVVPMWRMTRLSPTCARHRWVSDIGGK